MYTHTSLSMYIYIYIYVYAYTYIHTHTQVHPESAWIFAPRSPGFFSNMRLRSDLGRDGPPAFSPTTAANTRFHKFQESRGCHNT